MRVSVRFSEPMWRAVGERRVELELPGSDTSVANLIAAVEAAYPRFQQEYGVHVVDAGDDPILGRFVVIVHGNALRPAELAGLRLADGADVMLVSPMAGGAQ